MNDQESLIKEAKDPNIVGLTPKEAVAYLLCLLQDCADALAKERSAPVQEPVAWMDALKDAFFDGFTSVETYNDTLLNSPEEAWAKYTPPAAPVQEPEQQHEDWGWGPHEYHNIKKTVSVRIKGTEYIVHEDVSKELLRLNMHQLAHSEPPAAPVQESIDFEAVKDRLAREIMALTDEEIKSRDILRFKINCALASFSTSPAAPVQEPVIDHSCKDTYELIMKWADIYAAQTGELYSQAAQDPSKTARMADERTMLACVVARAFPTPAARVQEPQRNTATHEHLSTMIGLVLGARGGRSLDYKDGSIIDKEVRAAIEHLKDWPYPPPAAQRQWVGLTDEDVFNMPLAHHWLTSKTLRDAYRLGALDAEAKLREKNGGGA